MSNFSLEVVSPCTGITLQIPNTVSYYVEEAPLKIDINYTVNGGNKSACPVDIEIQE